MPRPFVFRVLVGALAVVAVAACDIDLFGFDRRAMVGPDGLYVGETQFYVILDKWDNLRPCAILEGRVTELGWNDKVILANQQTCSGKPSEWVVIHLDTGIIDPQIDSARMKARPELSRIQIMSAHEAWDRLGRR